MHDIKCITIHVTLRGCFIQKQVIYKGYLCEFILHVCSLETDFIMVLNNKDYLCKFPVSHKGKKLRMIFAIARNIKGRFM